MSSMGKSSYAFQDFDKSRHVRARIKDKDISHKHSREIALAIKGMSLEKSREFLERVLSKEIAVPYRRYNNEVAHRSNIRDGFFAGFGCALVAGLLLSRRYAELESAGFFGLVLGFYLVSLVAETVLVLPLVKMNSPVAKA